MISLNTPIGADGTAELLDLYGVEDTAADQVDAADAIARPLARLRPVERALVVEVHTGRLSVEAAAERLGKSVLAVNRMLRAAERKARGRKRSSGTPAPGAGKEQPVGTITVRKWHRCRVRFIKVRMDGPARKRWAPYATWLWEQRNGPKPAGKCVLHKDGNTLNDDPSNLILGCHADRAFLFQSRSDANYTKSMKARVEGCRRHNRERATARDIAGELRLLMWYAVDHTARVITGPVGRRKIHEAYAALGVSPPVNPGNSPYPWAAAQLGWPSVTVAEAFLLAAMSDRPGHGWTRSELTVAARAVGDRIGRPTTAEYGFLSQALWAARRRGFLVSTRHGVYEATHQITPAALTCRGTPCLLAVLRGRDCQPLKNKGYAVRPAAAGKEAVA